MTNTTNYPITIDGTRLDTLAYNVQGVKWKIPGTRSAAIVIPGVHGQIPSYEEDYEAGAYTLSMFLRGSDVDGVIPGDSVGQLRANLDTVLGLFAPRHRLLDVQETVAVGTQRQALCTVTDSIVPEVIPGRMALFQVVLTIPGAFWQDVNPGDWTQAGVVSNTVYDVSPLNGGTAPIQDAEILVTGPCTNPIVTDVTTGAWVAYTGSIAAGTKWFLNCGTFATRTGTTLTLNSLDTDGSDALGATTFSRANRFLTLTPALVAGTRKVQVKINGSGFTGASGLAVRARRRFL